MSIRMPHSCFVHIPRTGGLWFGEIVHQLGLKHQKLRGDIDSHLAFKEMPDNWRALYAFSFVRHPLAWLKSRWSHCIEHNLKEDHRHYGVHRLFDECVQERFVDTVRTILDRRPGIVGQTYFTMTRGIDQLFKTENLRDACLRVLSRHERINVLEVTKIIDETPPFNGTSKMDRYREEVESLPKDLIDQFLQQEKLALEIWHKAR